MSMNLVVLIGRLTRDPDIRYSQGNPPMCIARYTLAVDRNRTNQDGSRDADFISCVAFDKRGEFAEKYLHKGSKIAVRGHIQTGSYVNKENNKVYTTDVIIDEQEFAESKNDNQNAGYGNQNGGYGGAYGQQGYGGPPQGGYQNGGYGYQGQQSGGGYSGNQGYSGRPPQNQGYQQPQQAAPPQQQYTQQELPLNQGQQQYYNEGFMKIPDSVDDEGLPFN